MLVYFGIHKKVASALDARALRISKELEEARRLREEAEKLFADYRPKLGDVVREVDNIIALAAKQAETLAAETRQSLVDRRIKLAEEKIARAEMEAVRELRNDAVDVAIAAASASGTGEGASGLFAPLLNLRGVSKLFKPQL